jgi:hypothetical protein
VHVDSARGDVLVNREMFYTALAPSRLDAAVYTDNVDSLRDAVAREHAKEIALDAIKLQQQPPPTQQQQQSQ